MRRLTPFLVNLTAGGLARLLVPVVLDAGGERYTYYGMSLFFPYARCPSYHCFRFVPPLLASLLPLQVIDAFMVTGFVCQVLTGTLLWHIAERCHVSRRVALFTVCWYWAVWGPLPMMREPMLIADPVQALWLVTSLFLLLDGRYLLALPVLLAGVGVKESVLTVPVVYTAYLILAGDSIRGKIAWLATLIVMPLAAWVVVRRLLLTVFAYAPPGDSSYLAHPYLFGLWLTELGTWPHNLGIALLYVFAGFGAAWILGAFGLWHGDRRMRSLTVASAPAMAFLALYQEPHRAVAAFPWAVLIPAAAYVESLPVPLVGALLLANAALTLRMSATVAWLPPTPVLLALLFALTAWCVLLRQRGAQPGIRAATAPPPSGGRLTAAAIVAIAVVLIVLSSRDVLRARSFTRVTLATPPPVLIADDDTGAPGLAVSPDGDRLAFVGADSSAVRQLWMRPTNAETAEPLAGTEHATAPFWAPDGTSIGFFAGDTLQTVNVAGHGVRVVADARNAHGGTWNRSGVIVFAAQGGLYKVNALGGPVAPAVRADDLAEGTSYRWPSFLPDGEHVLFVERILAGDQQWIRVGSIESKESHRVMSDASAPVYAAPGVVFFLRWGGLLAQGFDTRRLVFEPFGVQVREHVANAPGFSRAAFAVSDRTLLVATATSDAVARITPHTSTLRWYDRAGRAAGDDIRRHDRPAGVALSPDERTVAFWTRDADGMPLLDLVHVASPPSPRSERRAAAVWSPDGHRLAFTVTNAARTAWEIQSAGLDGGTPRTLLTISRDASPLSWSPDGRLLVYLSRDPEAGDLWVLPLDGSTPPVPIARGALHGAYAQISPDGQWIAYTALNGAGRDVFVQPLPPTGQKWIVSTDGGEQPRWRADGKELIYVSSNRVFMSVDVETTRGFRAGAPRRLFEARLRYATDDMFQYAISRDAQRFLVDTIEDAGSSASVTLATGWRGALSLLDQK